MASTLTENRRFTVRSHFRATWRAANARDPLRKRGLRWPGGIQRWITLFRNNYYSVAANAMHRVAILAVQAFRLKS
jgi:hypothetical protein